MVRCADSTRPIHDVPRTFSCAKVHAASRNKGFSIAERSFLRPSSRSQISEYPFLDRETLFRIRTMVPLGDAVHVSKPRNGTSFGPLRFPRRATSVLSAEVALHICGAVLLSGAKGISPMRNARSFGKAARSEIAE